MTTAVRSTDKGWYLQVKDEGYSFFSLEINEEMQPDQIGTSGVGTMIVGHEVKQEAEEEVGEGESMSEDFSSVTDKELQEMKEEMLQDAATIVGQEVKEEVEEVATNTDAVEPAIPPTAKRRRLARWETQREQAAQTLIEAFVKMDEPHRCQIRFHCPDLRKVSRRFKILPLKLLRLPRHQRNPRASGGTTRGSRVGFQL
ncbi:unnamed protein product [Durusdinium trenchii]|uniref:Uncharacterized protein n=1 Tax=Durusdinium trenchii TaxID=1381693 RepID=A0ABP0S1K6_9DINO